MNIAEKLGIKPINLNDIVFNLTKQEQKSAIDYKYLRIMETVQVIEQQRNELLEGYLELLIEAINRREQTHGNFRGGPEKYYQEDIKIIQKADPQHRTWSEIKELL